MKTTHTLETIDEYLSAFSSVRQEGDPNPLPVMTGKLCVTEIEGEDHFVQIVGDPIYIFKIPFCEFAAQMFARCGCVLSNPDGIPK